MPLLPTDIYHLYVDFLEKRIATKQHLTEDSVRYAFFLAALQKTDIQQHEIILELPHPHPKFKGKEIDTHIKAAGIRPDLYIEFKFHRKSNSTSPKPQKAGSLFKDFSRLSSIKSESSRCLVIYLTDKEMAEYFTKNDSDYSSFWHTQTGDAFIYDEAFIEKTTGTFKSASGDLRRAKISVVFSAQLVEGHHLRVFEVNETSVTTERN